MGTIRKTTRSAQKKQDVKQKDNFKEIGTKILRTVMSVGFAMSSFIGQDVEASSNGIVRVDGTKYLNESNIANIYAEQVSGQVGLNRFQYFDVNEGQIANLHFTDGTNVVNTLVNTVNNKINIGGTVNAIRNNKISGNLYFLSPQGMVIGAGGVVNAGSLTVLTPTNDAFDQFKKVESLNFLDIETGLRNTVVIPINASGTIEVHGTINAATAVELQAGKIDVSKAANSNINPVIKTGVVFGNIVNSSAVVNNNQKLQAQVDSNGNVTFTDGSITGDGSIKLIATADKINDDANKQVVASVNVGQGATIDAVGNVEIKAKANHNIVVTSSTTSVTEHTANTKAVVTIDGNVKGRNVDIQANAQSTFNDTGLNGIEQLIGGTIENLADLMPEKIGKTLKDQNFSQKVDSDLFKQANFSYGGTDAEAIININEHADINAVSGDVNVNAKSEAITSIKGALIPNKSNNNGATANIDNPYLTLGIVYQENNSNSRVNVKGKIVSYNNLYVGSEAKAENDLALAIKKGNNLTANDAYIKAAIGILNQNANAEVNVGAADNTTTDNLLQATGNLDIKSDTQTKINSTVGIQSDLDSMLNTAINIVGGDVSSKVNINDAIQGGNVNITANHFSNGIKIITNNAFAETDSDFTNINNTGAKTNAISNNVKKVEAFVKSLKNKKNKSNNASGNLDQYFDFGASITIDDIANNVEVNISPDADIKATGANSIVTNNSSSVSNSNSEANGSTMKSALNINAAVKIADKQIKTISILGNNKATSALGVGAAVVVDNLTNNSAVNITSGNNEPQIVSEKGDVVIASKIDNGYTRTDNMGFTQKINPTNYPNVYVYSGVAKDIKDVVVATGTVGIQNINNNSDVSVGAGVVINANNKVDISATSIVGNALGTGKVGLPSDYNSNGIGGTVAIQNTNTNSKVTIANDVIITGGQIDINANNDVMNVGVAISGTKTSALGITGMVSYMGGTSNAEVAVDDDANLTATKEVTNNGSTDVVSKSGQININSKNDTTLTNVVGDVTSSGGIGLGASVGVISYDVHSLAQVKNMEAVDTVGVGTFSANSFITEALTDGTINNITIAGTSVGGTKKENSSSNVNVRDNNNQAGSTNNTTNLQNVTVSSNGVSNSSGRTQNNSSIKISEAGSVSWNDINNKTIAKVDGVDITLVAPENDNDKTTSLNVQAVDQSYIGAYSGAMALTQAGNNNNTSFSATLSGAVAVNDLVKETSAIISGSSISNALNIDNLAQNQGTQVAAGLALGIETGNRTNSTGVNVSANGSFNFVDSTVNAVMDGVTIAGNANNVNVDNIAYDKDVQIAGGITAEYAKSKVAAGAAIAVNKSSNDINAIIRNSNIGANNSAVNSVNNLAASKLTQVGSAVSVGFTASEQNLGILEAAVAVNNVSNNVNATIENSNVNAKTIDNKACDGEVATGITNSTYVQELAGQGFDVYGTDALVNATAGSSSNSTENNNGNNEINTSDSYSSSQIVTVNNGNLIVGTALGLSVRIADGSYSGTGGAGVVINNVKNDFNSKVSGSSLKLVGDNANLNVESISDTKIIGVAAGIAGSNSSVSAEGSVAKSNISAKTDASVTGTVVENNASKVNVKAISNSNLITSANALSVGAGSGLKGAIGAAVSIVSSDVDTSASITGSNIKAKDVIVVATSNNESLNVAIGLSVAASDKTSLSGAGNVANNSIDNDTTVTISETTIDASGTVAALANSNEVLRNYGGALSVSASTGSASVALGGTVVVNTITGDTGAIVQDSNIIALGTGNGVSVKDYTISKDAPISSASNSSTTNSVNGADVAKKMLQDKGTHSVTGNNTTKTGFVVDANSKHTLRDISVTAGVAASTGGVSGALDATVAVNTIGGKTSAEVNNTDVNNLENTNQINNTADIFVNAYDRVDMQSHIGTLSVGASSELGVGAASAVDVNNVNRETTAQISGVSDEDPNKNIVNGYSIDVNALGETDITITESGLAVGGGATAGGAITGSVSVNHFTSQTNAMVNGIISNAHQLNIEANRVADMQSYNNGAAISGGTVAASIGVGVTYVKDESSTNASLDNSSVERIGAVENSVVSLEANNKSSITTEAGSGSLALGLGGAVGTSIGVANMNNTTSVTISNTAIGKNSSFDIVDVEANNLLSSNFTNWAAGGGLVGIGVGVGVNTVNSVVNTNVINSEVYAKDIDVIAIETRNIKEVAVGATVGAVGIGVNVLNTNIGTAFADSFNYSVDDVASKDNYSTQGIVDAVNGALAKTTNTIDALQAKTDTSNVADNTIEAMDKGSNAGGVQTTIQDSILYASNELEIFNEATTNADIFAFQGSAGIAGVNVSVGVVDVESDLGITVNNANLKGKVIEIYSENDGVIKNDIYQATVGGVDVNVGYGSVTNSGNNQITIDGSNIKANGIANSNVDDLRIYAVNAVDVENIVRGFEISGVDIDTIISKAIDASNSEVNLGEAAGNNFTGSEICIEAYNDPHMKAAISTIGGGVSAVKVNVATAKASGKTTLNVDAKNNFDANKVELVAVSGEDKDDNTSDTKVITEANVLGGAPGVVSVSINKARTYNEMETTLNVGAANFYKTVIEDNPDTSTVETKVQKGLTNLIIGAVNSTDSIANIDEGSKVAGGVTSCSNFAQTNVNSNVTLNVDAGDKLHVNAVELYATNNETIKAIANGTNGSLASVSPYAAKVENKITSTTNLNIVGNVKAEDYFVAQALGKAVVNLKADAMHASVAGGSGTAVDSVITTTSNVNIGNNTAQANITSGGDMVVEAENTLNLNRADGFDKMVLGNGYGGVDVSVAHIDNAVNSNANVNLNNTNILSAGEVELIAHTNEDLRVNGYVYSTGVLNDSNNKVTNEVNNDENIVLNNSKIRLTDANSDLTLSAADDLKLFTYSLSETRFAALGVTTSFVDNDLNRENKISLNGDSDIFSMQDINLFAGKLVDGNLAKFDLDAEATAFNGSIIPIPINPKVTNDINQSNIIEISTGSESTSVRHTNIYADKGLEIYRVGAGAYNNYTGSQKTDIVTSLAGEVIKGKFVDNYVKINGRAVAGVGSNIKITIGEAGEIVILNADERNLVSSAKDKPTIKIDADESTGLTANSLKLGSEDYANALFNRYLELQALMSEYAKDGTNSKSYLGYSAEADRIANMMVNMGLAVKDSGELKMQNSFSVDYIEIPDIEASGGNITVDTGDFYGSGTIQAKGTSEVSIINNTNLLLKVNSIVIDEAGGKLVYNGNVLDSATSDGISVADTLKNQINSINSNVKNVGFNKVAAETNSEIGINIQGTHNGNIQYSYIVEEGATSQTIIHNVKPLANIQIQGDIINREGSVTISSTNNDIVIQGQTVNDSVAISGTTVSLSASNGSIAQGYTDGIVNIGGSVKDQYADVINGTQTGVNESVTDKVNTPADGSTTSGSYIAGGSVYINAADINVNGIIQSGYADYNVTIDDTVQNRINTIENNYDGIREISDYNVTIGDSYKIVDGGAYWNATTGCYEYRLNAYYNPATKKIIIEDVDASGGRVYLTGRISSTGNGQIICLDGVSDVTINNSLNYDMKLGEVVVNDVDGLVSIKDLAKNTLTEISSGQVTVSAINADGIISNSGTISNYVDGYVYNPLADLRYEWTTGTDTTTYTRYSYEEIKALWGLWKPSATTEQLNQWSVENNKISSGTNLDVPRKEGEFIVVDSSYGDSSYSQTTSSNEYSGANTKESERYWSTGFLGFNKHHEVIWTQSSGKVTTVHHSVKADNPINVKFIGNTADTSQIMVDTVGNLELTGNVGNTKLYEIGAGENTSQNYLGKIDITAQNGSVIQIGGNLIGSNINLAAGEDIRDIDILAGDVVNVSAVNLMTASTNNVHLHSIGLNIKQAYGTNGNVELGDVGTVLIDGNGGYTALTNSTGVTANVSITAVGDIFQTAGKVVSANRIDLTTEGSIYGQKVASGEGEQATTTYTGLNVYAGQQPIGLDTLDASVNATAEGDINLEQVNGDMRIGRIYSQSGDVTLTVANGSIVDALPYVSQDRGEIDEMIARWESLGIIKSADGTDASGLMAVKGEIDNASYEAWDKNALLYAIEDSIVNPDSDKLHTTSSKDPNIIGHNITLNVKDSAGFFGDGSKEINITTLFDKKADDTYVNSNALEDLMALSKADASTVSWKTNSSGDKIAVISQVLPVGIQQTVKTVVNGDVTETVHGKLVVESTDSYVTDGLGDIFLEGRNEKDVDNLFINSGNITNDLFIGQLITQTGDVHLSSLGSIINSAEAGQVAIQANNLIVSAANGSIGTKGNELTIKLDGFQGTLSSGTNTIKEGTLSAVASGGIYVDQKVYDLAIKNISSGGDIDLSADKSIFMETVNGTDAINYIRAENNGNITLLARDGSLGKSSTGGRNTNDGIRILNDSGFATGSNDENFTVVTLKASDDIYVTGIASSDGKTVAQDGSAGVLNLVVERYNKDVSPETALLDNVGISVDGKLNLLSNLESLDKVSVYTSNALDFNNNVRATDVYISSGKDLSITDGADIFATDKVTLAVENDGYDINIQGGNVGVANGVVTPNVVVYSANDVNMEGGNIIAENAEITAVNDIVFNSGDLIAATATLTANQDVLLADGSLITDNANLIATKGELKQILTADGAGHEIDATNLTVKAGQGISLGSNENKLNNVFLDISGGGILIGNGNIGNDVLQVSVKSGVDALTNDITIHNYKNKGSGEIGNDLFVEGLLKTSGDITLINDESDIEVLSDDSIEANDVTLKAVGNINNHNRIIATQNVILDSNASINNLDAGDIVITDKGNITMNANGIITNTGDIYVIKGDISLKGEQGVVNGYEENNTKGNVIALGGSVIMESQFNIENHGDIIAIGDNVNDAVGSGSITLKSHYGNVYNYDDFNVVDDGNEMYPSKYNLATSNITFSAVNGIIYNHKDYLVALGDITLEAKEGIGNSSEVFMAGGNITLSDTDGDLSNTAKLISVDGDITLNANNGAVVNVLDGDVLALNGNVTFNAKGDITNYGDVVALNGANQNNKGSISFVSLNGNVSNYDNFKLVDGNNYYDYDGTEGFVKFNEDTPYHFENRYILTDSDLTMKALNGSIFNNMEIDSAKNITLVSGNDLVIGSNVANVISKGDVIVQSLNGDVKLQQGSKVLSSNGDIVIDGNKGVEVVEGSILEATKGSISVVSSNGAVSVAKMFANEMANVGSNSNDVIIGVVQGKKVVLFSQGADAKIDAQNIKVQDYLVLQSDNVVLGEIDRSSNKGTLNVDVSGANGGTMNDKLSMDLEGDVRFTTANVTDAEVYVGGKLCMDKVHVAGKGHFSTQGYVTGIYGIAPSHDGSNALYFNFGNGYGPTVSTTLGLNAASFTTDNALNVMDSLNYNLDAFAQSGDTFNKDNSGWMNLYVDGSKVQRSNGALLRIDTHYTSYNQRWSAEDIASKQNDFKANYAYDYHFEDRPVLFNRNNLYDIPEDIVIPVVGEQADNKDNGKRNNVLNFEEGKV